jgi:uncharacterized protein involved in outer membrane biogenesis
MNKVWKIIKIVLLVLLGLLIAAIIAGFIFLKNFDIKKYKPQIVAAAQKSLGRPVNFEDIDLQVSLKEGIRLNLKNFTIAEGTDFGTEDFVEIGTVSVGVDILSFVNARQISIPNILVQSPRINVIRNAAGKLNVETIGTPSQPATTASSSAPSSPAQGGPATPPSAAPAALPAIFINSLRIENAQLNYIDRSVNPPLEASVSQLDFGVDHFSLAGPFSFFVEAAILSPRKNFKVDGTAQLNLHSNEVRLNNVRVASDLGLLSLDEIRGLPMLKGVPIPEVLEGQYTANIKECVVSDKGLGDLTVDTRLSNGKIAISQVAPGLALSLSAIDFAVSDFSLGRPFNVSLQAAYLSDVPNIDFKGVVSLDMKTQGVRLKNAVFATDLGLWPLEKLKASLAPLKDVPLPEKLTGQFQTTIKDLAAGPQGVDSVLADVVWQNGDVIFEKAVPGISVRLTKTNLAIRDFSLNGPFQISLQTGFLNEEQNISVDGTAKLDAKTKAVRLKDMKMAVDLDSLPPEKIKASVAALKDVPLPQVLGGKLTTTVKSLEAGPAGLVSVVADVNLSEGKVAMKDAAPGISIDARQVELAVKNFSLTEPFQVNAKLAYLSDVPNISFSGLVAYNMKTQDARLKDSVLSVDFSKLNLEALKASVASLKDVALPENLAGTFSARINDLSAGPKGVGTVALDVDWKDGAVSMKSIAPGISVTASQIGLSLKNVSLGQPFGFHLQAAYLSDQPNIDLGGTVSVDPQTQMIQLKDTNFKTDLATFSMDRLRASVAPLKDVPLPQSLKGLFNLSVTEATAGPKGLASLKTQGALSGGSIHMKELAVPVDAVELKFQADQTNATIDGLSMTIGGKGTVKAQGNVADYLAKQDFNAQLEVKDIDLAEVVAQEKAPVKVAGLLNANVKAQGQVANLNSITGDGQVEIKEAKLKDLNVLKLVLDKIAVIPNLSEKVKGSLPEKYTKKLEDKDTAINKVAATITIAAGAINVNPIDVEADEFMFNGQCQADFAQKYALTGAFMIPQELAAAMVQGVPELQYLLDVNGNISFPLRVSGQGGAIPSVTPDVGNLMKNAVINKGKAELGRVLHKVLGGKDNAADSQTGTQQNGEKSPEQQLIDGVFGTIFK